MLRIRLINPLTESDLIDEFLRRQQDCYAGFSVERAAKKVHTKRDRSVHFVVAETMSGEMVGGARFHVRTDTNPLPIEKALPEDDRIHKEMAARQMVGVAEYAGLWARPEGRGTGLSAVLISTTVAASALHNVRCGLGFTHHHLIFWTPLGFQVDNDLGFFPYPDHRYQSYVLWIDPMTLSEASPEHRHGMTLIQNALRRTRSFLWDPALGADFDTQLRPDERPFTTGERPAVALPF